MSSFGPEHPTEQPDGPEQGDDGAPSPGLPTLPPRVSISTSPPWTDSQAASGQPGQPGQPGPASQSGQPGQALPYGASSMAPYMVPASPRAGRLKRLLLPLLVLALVGGGVAVLFRDRLFPSSGGPAYPKEWDPRVADLATFVAGERDLSWVHPVFVDFLTEAEFVALFDPSTTQPTAEATAAAASRSLLYNAFGLAGDYDATQGEASVSAVTTLGFYSVDTDRVYVRGDQLTPAVQVVLAHELTHALQAQHFDLSVEGADDLELRAIVEADALRVENVYRATLPAVDRAAADEGNSLAPEAEADLDGVPWAVVEERYAPYVLGPTLVADVFATDGNSGVDSLIRTPPTEEVLLNPWLKGTEQREEPVTVTVPDGATVIDEPQALSELDMLLMLDAWLPWRQARNALEGWAGGGYASYDQDGKVCFTASASFDQSGDLFAKAITDWAAAAGSTAVPVVIVNDVTFEACARGATAAEPEKPVISPLQALSLEHDVIALAGSGASQDKIDKYRCFAGTMIDDPLLAPLIYLDTRTTDEQALFTWQSTIAANACGVPPLTP
ncbi:MAG: hypothetical protein WCC60_01695 [Ilumatobacteraceae bacterium]